MVNVLRRKVVWVTTLLVLSLATVEMPHLGAAHHDDFDLVFVAHDGSAHHVGSGSSDEASRPDHCLACHWGRAFRPGVESSTTGSPLVEAALARVPEQPFVPARAPVAQPPLRSPPSAAVHS